MDNEIMEMGKNLMQETMKNVNSNISVDLNGWPAAAGVIAVCITGIAICGIKEFSNFQQAKIMHA